MEPRADAEESHLGTDLLVGEAKFGSSTRPRGCRRTRQDQRLTSGVDRWVPRFPVNIGATLDLGRDIHVKADSQCWYIIEMRDSQVTET